MLRGLTSKAISISRVVQKSAFSGTAAKQEIAQFNLFNPTEEHAALREMLRTFVEAEVDPQAREFNRKELFNVPLFRKLGDLGLLGITVDTEYGGSGMDATAAVIAHGS
jgi:alkylation response protein AidB-like acyl-CoA dehydrogenase